MSMFDLKGGSSNNWNYSYKNKAGYMTMIEGTVVEISNPQSLNYKTRKPEFWDDGNPKRNLRLTLLGRSGQELSWTFVPKSLAAQACLLALDPNDSRESVSLEELLGKFVRIQTKEGVYNQSNPRPWWVTVQGDGDAGAVRGVVDLSKQNAPTQQAPQMQQAPAPVPTQFQQAQAMAQQAVANQNFQTPPPPVEQVPYEQDPTGGYYDADIPF